MIKCARAGCEETFFAATHNQKFHNAECCRISTNQRIMEKYYDRRDQRLGKPRYCSDCTTTKLSRYNDDKICSGCKIKNNVLANKTVTEMLLSVSWQQ